jgi:uncharacterized protein YyaL (SSP411 family)
MPSRLLRLIALSLTLGLTSGSWCSPPPKRAPSSPGPGATPLPDAVVTAIDRAWQERGDGYLPRTRHRREDGGPVYTNRLFLSSSPYLLQHAHNPVGWFPWGDESFALARKLGRPVFLSVGYSTCHWCHVMEEESFEDEAIAELLNTRYIPIKVDREERPDVDSLYMAAVRRLTRRGGWPMSVWLTPDRKPFFAGTYFPPHDGARGVRKGFATLLSELANAYASDPSLSTRADQLAAALKASLELAPVGGEIVPDDVLKVAIGQYAQQFDKTHGGIGAQRKFPSSLPLRLLTRLARRSRDPGVVSMLTLTLDKMARGGLHDQVGGGFHRYTVDAEWLVPHFEKMLYDNALLAMAYLEAWQLTGSSAYRTIAERTLRYLDRDMRLPSGGFASATDADSPLPSPDGGVRHTAQGNVLREEGHFFTWTPTELKRALGPLRARAVMGYFGVTPAGHVDGRSVLHQPRPHELVAKDLQLTPAELAAVIDEARDALYTARRQRPPPLRDDKVLTAWNGLAIAAFAQAGFAFDNKAYLDTASAAAELLWAQRAADGRLVRVIKEGRGHGAAVLDDYAFYAWGLLALFQATGERRWLERAQQLDAIVAAHYEAATGGFFLVADDHEPLLARERPTEDGARPSGTSVHTLNLLRLYELTLDERYRRRAAAAVRSVSAQLTEQPTSMGEMLIALEWLSDRTREVVVVSPPGTEPSDLLLPVRSVFAPNQVWVLAAEGGPAALPLLEGKVARDGKPTAYVCEQNVCKEPTTDAALLMLQLTEAMPYAWNKAAGAER